MLLKEVSLCFIKEYSKNSNIFKILLQFKITSLYSNIF